MNVIQNSTKVFSTRASFRFQLMAVFQVNIKCKTANLELHYCLEKVEINLICHTNTMLCQIFTFTICLYQTQIKPAFKTVQCLFILGFIGWKCIMPESCIYNNGQIHLHLYATVIYVCLFYKCLFNAFCCFIQFVYIICVWADCQKFNIKL